MNSEVKPVDGAARYFAAIDKENCGVWAVWMETPPDEHNPGSECCVLGWHRGKETAGKMANKWQGKENKSVLGHFPGLGPTK